MMILPVSVLPFEKFSPLNEPAASDKMRRFEVLEFPMSHLRRKRTSALRVRKALPLLLLLAVFSPSAQAYLDPSTGSMIVTAIVGLLASIGLAIRTYWYRLKSFFKGGRKERQEANDAAESDSSSSTPRNTSD
jgi:hypothetical protein